MTHLSDIEIANSVSPRPIEDIAASVGLKPEQLFRYGRKTLDTALQSQLSAHGFSQNLLDNQLAAGLNLLNLYKAIGSGWQEEGKVPTEEK